MQPLKLKKFNFSNLYQAICLLIIFFITSYNSSIAAEGAFTTPGVGAKAIGLGNAFTAVADSPETIFYNPAGLVQIPKTNINVGASHNYVLQNYTRPDGYKAVSRRNIPIPNLFFTTDKLKAVRLGFGLYAPFGNGTNFKRDRRNGFPNLEAELARIDSTPTIAIPITDKLSVGAGVNITYTDFNARQPAGGNMALYLSGSGFGVGGIFGVLYRPTDKISLGTTFRTKVKSGLDGHSILSVAGANDITDNFDVNFRYPSHLVFGVAIRPIKKLLFAYDLAYNDWGVLDALNFNFNSLPRLSVPFEGRKIFAHKTGVEYLLNDTTALRLGYSYSPSPIPSRNILPTRVSGMIHSATVGFGKKFERFNLDFAYQIQASETLEVTDNLAGFNGTVDGLIHNINANLTYQF